MKIVFSSKKNPSALSELMEKEHIIEHILVIIRLVRLPQEVVALVS